MLHLEQYGWNEWFAAMLATLEEDVQHDTIARVIQEHREAYLVQTAAGRLWAEISGKMRHEGAVRADFPAVGDWVTLRGMEEKRDIGNAKDETRNAKQETGGAKREMEEREKLNAVAAGKHAQRGPDPTGHGTRNEKSAGGSLVITRILPRRTVLVRRLEGAAGGDDQILAVNVDVAFLGTSLNENFNLRRLERYITLARDAGARPVVLLTKGDLCADAGPFVAEVRRVGGEGIAIHVVSVVTGAGMDAVKEYLKPGTTAVVLGSSGVGKSTLVNHLAEADIQDMMETRDLDDKGRHCTTFRHLIRTAAGGLIIDTPGLRGLSLGEATDALLGTFGDVEALAAQCKFTDCRHETEPGCAIKGALERGELEAGRFESYQKLQREVAVLAQRENRITGRKQKKLAKRATAALDKKRQREWGR